MRLLWDCEAYRVGKKVQLAPNIVCILQSPCDHIATVYTHCTNLKVEMRSHRNLPPLGDSGASVNCCCRFPIRCVNPKCDRIATCFHSAIASLVACVSGISSLKLQLLNAITSQLASTRRSHFLYALCVCDLIAMLIDLLATVPRSNTVKS